MGDQSNWHLDRRVPIAFIVAIVLQTGGMVWWAARLSSDVEHAAEARTEIARRVTKIESERDDLRERMVRVEVQLEALTDISQQILALVEERG